MRNLSIYWFEKVLTTGGTGGIIYPVYVAEGLRPYKNDRCPL